MNSIEQPLKELFATTFSKTDKHPTWVTSLAFFEPAMVPQCLLFQLKVPSHEVDQPGVLRRRLDPIQPLSTALEGLSFTEFPDIEVSTRESAPQDGQKLPLRRPKKVPDNGLKHFLGEYESDQESSYVNHDNDAKGVLDALNQYADSSSDSGGEEGSKE
jgi:hypothetical protein